MHKCIHFLPSSYHLQSTFMPVLHAQLALSHFIFGRTHCKDVTLFREDHHLPKVTSKQWAMNRAESTTDQHMGWLVPVPTPFPDIVSLGGFEFIKCVFFSFALSVVNLSACMLHLLFNSLYPLTNVLINGDCHSWEWWHLPIIPAIGKLGSCNPRIVSLRPTWATYRHCFRTLLHKNGDQQYADID